MCFKIWQTGLEYQLCRWLVMLLCFFKPQQNGDNSSYLMFLLWHISKIAHSKFIVQCLAPKTLSIHEILHDIKYFKTIDKQLRLAIVWWKPTTFVLNLDDGNIILRNIYKSKNDLLNKTMKFKTSADIFTSQVVFISYGCYNTLL